MCERLRRMFSGVVVAVPGKTQAFGVTGSPNCCAAAVYLPVTARTRAISPCHDDRFRRVTSTARRAVNHRKRQVEICGVQLQSIPIVSALSRVYRGASTYYT